MADAIAREVKAIQREDDLRELVRDGRERAELALPRLLRRHQIAHLQELRERKRRQAELDSYNSRSMAELQKKEL